MTASVFNVDWSAPLGLPLAISLGISLLGTAVLRGRCTTWATTGERIRTTGGSWTSPTCPQEPYPAWLVSACRSHHRRRDVRAGLHRGRSSGLDDLALLLAILVAFIMLLSAALVFGTSFRDGSPEQDDLAHYSRLVHDGLHRRRDHEDRAARLRHERDMLRRSARGSTGEGVGDGHASAAATDDTYAPATMDAAEARETVIRLSAESNPAA